MHSHAALHDLCRVSHSWIFRRQDAVLLLMTSIAYAWRGNELYDNFLVGRNFELRFSRIVGYLSRQLRDS
jgi:hypothetical protein